MPRQVKDEIGKRYGLLTVMRLDSMRPSNAGLNRAYWLCKCDCGQEKAVLGDHLRSGATKSCADCTIPKPRKYKDEKGKIYGSLTVLEAQPKGDRETRWICRCACGTETVVRGSDLRMGVSKSCGCYLKRRAA